MTGQQSCPWGVSAGFGAMAVLMLVCVPPALSIDATAQQLAAETLMK